jgi:N-glycosylase/DNA lyase
MRSHKASPYALDRLENAISHLCESLRGRVVGATPRWSESALRFELINCCLGSQVPFEMAVAAAGRLRREGLLRSGAWSKPRWLARAVCVLAGPLGASYQRAYRFPNVGARRTMKLLEWTSSNPVGRLLREAGSASTIRAQLMSIGCGLGPKQSSLFLRNIGWSADLAILDVHVLSYMRLRGLAEEGEIPTSLKSYEQLEHRFRAYAGGRGEPLGRLDLAVWIAMRTARAEGLL